MKKLISLSLLALITVTFVACGEKGKTGDGTGTDSTATNTPTDDNTPKEAVTQWEKDGLKVYSKEDSPEYADAQLSIVTPPSGADLAEGKNKFQFEVGNYTLGQQTEGAADNGLANSGKGQHIHLILNNGPYSAHYEPEFMKELEADHYVMLAFLARSYHESVKAPGAAVIQQFVVGQPENYKEADLTKPHMFYSRPKGTYKGADTEKLLLDFYLANCDLSPEGNKVRATINGVEFTFTKWVPYIIEGLPKGEITIKLELLDKDGNLVESPFNPVERTVTLAEADAE